MDPISVGIGGALSLGGMVYGAIKGGQAARANEKILTDAKQENESWFNNNRNYFDTVQGKSALEQVRQAYEERAKRNANTAVITGASAEQEVALQGAQSDAYNNAMRQLAGQGSEYASRNEMVYRQNLNNLMNKEMAINDQKAENAANLATNAGNLFGSAAMSGMFEKGAFAKPSV